MATFPSIKSDLKVATKPLYAGAGVTDLAVELVRDYVTEAQKRFAGAQQRVIDLDLEPKALRDQATTVVNTRVDALAKDAKALPAKVQAFVDENVSAVNDTYGDLVARGESLVTRIRNQESSKATAASAKTTTAKAKTTKTQATKTAKATTKKATSTAKKKSAAPKSSAKATTTAAKKTASSATKAATDAAAKVGD